METKKIEIEVNDNFIPELYALLNGELIAAKKCMEDMVFTDKYPNLAARARRTVENLDRVCKTLIEEYF